MLYLRRMIWFIASRLVLLCVLAGMAVCGFFMAMNLSNIYIILDEGMEKRAEVILTREDAEELNKYFHYDFLNADEALAGAFSGVSAYDDYTITDFEYDLTVEKLWAWPWDSYASCTIVERIPSITGKALSSRANEVSETIPKWQGGRYNVTLVKENGYWKIKGMQQIAVLMESESNENPQGELLVE